MLEHDSGRIALDGHEVAHLRGRVGYMLQRDLLMPWRTVLENVIAGQHLRMRQSWWQGLLNTPAQRREERERVVSDLERQKKPLFLALILLPVLVLTLWGCCPILNKFQA